MIVEENLVLLVFSGIRALGAAVSPQRSPHAQAQLSIRPSRACQRALIEMARARARPMQS